MRSTLASIADVPRMMAAGQLDVFATNKGILSDVADRVPGSRILEGGYATEVQTLAIPRGRDAGTAYLTQFVNEARGSGLVKQASERARLRGVDLR